MSNAWTRLMVVALLALAASFVPLAQAQYAASGLPAILVDQVDPQPAQPGQDITIDVRLFNNIGMESSQFSVVLDAARPLVLKSATKQDWQGKLCAGCTDRNTYFLSVESGAASAVYPAFVRLYSGDTEIRQRIDVKVVGTPDLVFSSLSAGLDQIVPDQQFPALLAVTNIGSGPARQVKVQATSPDFIALGSSVRTLETLDPGETKTLLFDFLAASSLAATSHSLPFALSYQDDQGHALSTEQALGVRVVNVGTVNIQSIKIASASGPAILAGQPFTAVVRLENVGKGDASSIVANLTCPFSRQAKRAFLGQLKKDEDAPAVFDLTATDGGNFMCGLLVSYTDDTGLHQFSEKFDVSVSPANYLGSAAIVVVVIVLAFVFRKRVFKMLGIKR